MNPGDADLLRSIVLAAPSSHDLAARWRGESVRRSAGPDEPQDETSDGALLVGLHALEARGAVVAEWLADGEGRVRRRYRPATSRLEGLL